MAGLRKCIHSNSVHIIIFSYQAKYIHLFSSYNVTTLKESKYKIH